MPTEGPLENSLYLLTQGNAEVVFATHGMLRPSSVDAAVKNIKGVAQQSLDSVANLGVQAVPQAPNTTPTASISGPVESRVITIGIPEGKPGMGYAQGQQLLADSAAVKTDSAQVKAESANILTLAQEAQAAALEIPDANTAAMVGNPATQTRTALDTYLSVGPAPTGGDDTNVLQTFLAANAGRAVKLPPLGSYKVNGTLTPGPGTRLDAQGSTITQTSTSKVPLFDATALNGFTVSNATLVGNPALYDDTVSVYPACAVRAGTNSKRIRLLDSTIRGFAGPALYASGASDIRMSGCDVVGVGQGGGSGSFAFVAGTSKDNAGVIIDNSCSRVWIVDNDFGWLAQGILGGGGNNAIRIAGNNVHDIGGQHGVYLNHCRQVTVSGNTVARTKTAGIKVQTQSAAPDVIGLAITGNVIDDVAANGIILTCASNTVPSRLTQFSITGNTVRAALNDGIVVEFVARGIVTGNVIDGARAGIRVTDFDAITVATNRIANTLSEGILVQSLVFSSTDFTVAGNDIRNPAQSANAASNFGIRIAEGAGLTTTDGWLRDNKITDTTGKTRYLIYVASASPTTIGYRNNAGTGATDYGHRGPATTAREAVGNHLVGNLGAWFSPPQAGTPGQLYLDVYGTAAPTTGSYVRGQKCWNTGVTAGQPSGWVCVTTGTPGTWSPLPSVA